MKNDELKPDVRSQKSEAPSPPPAAPDPKTESPNPHFAAVGKTFTAKADPARRYKVSAHCPNFDFGAHNGGRADAFVVARLDKAGWHYARAAQFLAEHEEIKAEG